MNTKTEIVNWLNRNQSNFTAMADEIWANPEIRFEEFKASKLQADFLEEVGFAITWDVGGISTAFMAEWGSGGPIIGFAGEYDALPGLSQKLQSDPDPVEAGGHGHGCGHNLLGTGCLAATVAVKQWLQETGTPGTVRYYGCPAEEGGGGKIYMGRDGAFDDLDAAFNFHPGYTNYASKGSMLGVQSMRFRFHGRTAHAAAMPEMGRSALDAVELMNVGVNYMREHVADNVRIHYIITDGGLAANIVPDRAEVHYVMRAHLPHQVQAVVDRVRKVAQGAALMTETEVEEIFVSGTTCVLNNHALADLQYEVMQSLGPIQFTAEEMAYAAEINANNPPGNSQMIAQYMGLSPAQANQPLVGDVFPSVDIGRIFPASSDVGDMSWRVPLSMLNTTCWPTNVPAHSWGIVASGGMSIGHKGMMYAAQVMSQAAIALFVDPARLAAVRAEFEASLAATPYFSPVPADVQPPKLKHLYR
ncbi:MAG: amidohydrolase [Anaerolineales bacterium]|nr:amidohydrolase [Anaerolineales bacterium]